MPSWGIHLVTANEILKRVNISDKNAFIIGNFIPDAEKHVIKDFSFFTIYDTSHFAELQEINGYSERLPNPISFLDKYKEKMKNPLVIGYLTHLLTDYYWNKITDTRYTIRDENGNFIGLKINDGEVIKSTREERRKMKHNDFYLFEQHLINIYDFNLPIYEEKLLQYSSEIEEVNHNNEDFEKIVSYLCDNIKKNKEKVDGEYRLFIKEQMELDFNESIEFIIDFFKKYNIVC